MKQRSSSNYVLTEIDMEKPKGVSLTVQNDFYTVEEILVKYRAGIPLDIQHEGDGIEDPDFNDLPVSHVPGVDIVDVYEQLNEITAKINELNKQLDTVKDENKVNVDTTKPSEV